jgi:DUF4097 and DUF4098 domain-containing protein YvlB
MKLSKYLLLITVIALSFTSFNCYSKRYEKKESVEYKINTDKKIRISIENISGKIDIQRADSTEGLSVKADMVGSVRKRDLDKHLENVSVEIDTIGDEIRIKGYINKEKTFFNFHNINESIDFKLRVPPGLPITIDNVNGSFNARNISNDIKLTLVNGDITLENTSGKNEIDVTNGKVKGVYDSTKGINIDAINGSITLTIPKTYEGSIIADVVNGKIKYDNLALTNMANDSDEFDEKKSLRAYIGNKQKEVKCDLVNGKIEFIGK